MDFSKINVVRLDNRNYRSWSFKVQMLLRREGSWGYVNPGTPPNPVTPEWTAGDSKALATIALLVEDSQHNLIMGKATAKAAWDALQAHHHKATLTGKVALLKEVCSASFKEGESMEEFICGMEELYSRLENSGEKLSKNMQVAMILRSLPRAFDALTTALESRSDEELTMELVRSKLVDESEKLYGDKIAAERVLKASSSNTKAAASAGVAVCYFCGKPGHMKRSCKDFLSQKQSEEDDEKKKNRAEPEQKVKTVRENDKRSFTFMVRESVNKSARSWLIDSGAESHICSDKSAFTQLESSRVRVTTADGNEARAEGIGECLIECVNDVGESIKLTLRGVLYVPTLEENVISVSKLTSRGCRAYFAGSVCELVYGNTVVAVGDKIGDMYWLRMVAEKVMKAGKKHHIKDCQHSWRRHVGQRDSETLNTTKRKKRQPTEGQQRSTRLGSSGGGEVVEIVLKNVPMPAPPVTQSPHDAESEEEFCGWEHAEGERLAEVFGEYDLGVLQEDVEQDAAAVEQSPQPEVRCSERATADVLPKTEPKTYHEVISSPRCAERKSALEEAKESHRENGTCDLTELPPNRKAIGGCKWTYKHKIDEKGKFVHYEARLMGESTANLYGQLQEEICTQQYRVNEKGYQGRLERMNDVKILKVPMGPGYRQQREEMGKKLESVEQYQSLVAALLNVAVCARPDDSIAVSILGRRVQPPTEADWNGVERVLRYLKSTMDLDLCLGNDDALPEYHVGADWADAGSDQKPSSGGVIGRSNRRQECVALSSNDAEYAALAECLQELLWMRKLMDGVGVKLKNLREAIGVKQTNVEEEC